MDYNETVTGACPVEFVQRLDEWDLKKYADGFIFSDLLNARERGCAAAIANALTAQIVPGLHYDTYRAWLGIQYQRARALDPSQLQATRAAALRIDYEPRLASKLLPMLWRNEIDLRAELAPRFADDRPDLTDEERWWWGLYLAHMGEPGAMDLLAAVMSRDTEAYETINRFDQIARFDTPEAKALIASYSDDPRRTMRTAGGYGPTVGEYVRKYLLPE